MKTAKSNFGGGNTHWEEQNLGSYAFRYAYSDIDNVISVNSVYCVV